MKCQTENTCYTEMLLTLEVVLVLTTFTTPMAVSVPVSTTMALARCWHPLTGAIRLVTADLVTTIQLTTHWASAVPVLVSLRPARVRRLPVTVTVDVVGRQH